MSTGISALREALQTKIASKSINIEDGLSLDEVKQSGLSASEIAEIKNAGFTVDQNIDLDVDAAKEIDAAALDLGDIDTDDLQSLLAKKDEIEGIIAQLKTSVQNLEQWRDAEQEILNELNNKYQTEVQKLEEKQNQFDQNQKNLGDLNEEILATQQYETKRYEGKISDITSEAINEYNPAKHGDDFNAFLNDKLSGVGIYAYSGLDSLNSEAASLANQTNGLLDEIKSQTNVVRELTSTMHEHKSLIESLNGKISAINTNIEVQETNLGIVNEAIAKLVPGAGLTPAEVLASVSEEEMNLAKSLNIDLTETYENGNPRYVFAMGADEKFHIYEMDESGTSGTTLARQFGKDTGGLRGSDIVPSGSGYMRNARDVDGSEGGRAVYSFSSINEDWTDGETCCKPKCYCTCSPLSFDVDGDGVKTSSETVKYDIDGDGILDTVNNSAEWVLAFDKDGNGIAGENGSELFGDNTDLDGDGKKDGYKNGFEALKALAQKEGLVGPNGGVLDAKGLKFLEEKYGLVMTKGYGGEAKSLSDLGITEINLSNSDTKLTKNFDGRHNDIMTQEGATFKVNGQTREYADIWNAKLDEADINKDKTPRIDIENKAFDIDSINFDFGNKLINQTKSLDAVFANKGEVDYRGILSESKIATKVAQSRINYDTETETDTVQNTETEQQDNDFISFQKKKIK